MTDNYFLLLTCYFLAVVWPFFCCTVPPSHSCLFPPHPAPWMPYEFAVSREWWLVGVILVVLPVSQPRRGKDLSKCDCLRLIQTTQFMSDSPRYESHTLRVWFWSVVACCHCDVICIHGGRVWIHRSSARMVKKCRSWLQQQRKCCVWC